MSPALLCLELEYDEAKKIYDKLQQEGPCRVLEFLRREKGKSILLAEGSNFDNNSIIPEPHPELLMSYFRLLSTQVHKNLCILESSSLIELMRATNYLMKSEGFQGIEIYHSCSSTPHISLLCNGSDEPKLPESLDQVQMKLIQTLNDYILKEFF